MIWDFYHFHASQTTLQVLSGKSNFWKGNGLIRHRENHGRKVTKTNYLPTKHGEILVDHYRDSGLFDFSFFFMYRQKHISINFQIYIYIYTYIYTKVLIYESYKTRYFIIIISYINHWPFFCNSLSLSLSHNEFYWKLPPKKHKQPLQTQPPPCSASTLGGLRGWTRCGRGVGRFGGPGVGSTWRIQPTELFGRKKSTPIFLVRKNYPFNKQKSLFRYGCHILHPEMVAKQLNQTYDHFVGDRWGSIFAPKRKLPQCPSAHCYTSSLVKQQFMDKNLARKTWEWSIKHLC